jgi:hypothetical protein
VQAGWPPYLTITAPSSKTYNFGSSQATRNVTFNTNATRWWMETDANYQYVVSSASRAGVALSAGQANAVTTSVASPTDEVEASVTFTPETAITSGSSTLSTTVRFRTLTGATETSDAVTLTRSNPEFQLLYVDADPGGVDDYFRILYTEAEGSTIYLCANTRISWMAEFDNTIVTRTVNGYEANSIISIPVPALDKNDPSNWGTTLGTIFVGHLNCRGMFPYEVLQYKYYLFISNIKIYRGTHVDFDYTTNAFSWEIRFLSSDGSIDTYYSPSSHGGFDVADSAQDREVKIYNTSLSPEIEIGTFTIPATP